MSGLGYSGDSMRGQDTPGIINGVLLASVYENEKGLQIVHGLHAVCLGVCSHPLKHTQFILNQHKFYKCKSRNLAFSDHGFLFTLFVS